MLECTALCGLRDAAAGGAPQCAIAATAIAAADGARLCCGSPCKPGGMSFDEGDAPMSLRQWVQDYALSQLRGKATVRVPLTWIPYFMRKESDAEPSMGGLHGRTALIPVAVVLLVGAAALLGLSYRVRQRRAARARLGLV
mmetsp:Transcript_16883/g.54990  ORF Transcript_16883/g.54990 Transcript_16883/m.54990 type:complete len:141 (-) Transcript_16883:541-963(-)